MPRGAARHDGRRHNEGRKRHVNEPERERRIEDDLQPVERHDPAVHDVEALRRLHPTVRRKDPKRREQRTECDQARGEKMQACTDALPAEQHDAEETGFEEKRRQDLVGEQRSVDGTGDAGEAGPVCAELVGHHDTGDDAHAETDCENLRPEEKEFAINHLAGSQPQALEHGAIVREPDADRGEDDVGRDRERELQPREYQDVTRLEHQTCTPLPTAPESAFACSRASRRRPRVTADGIEIVLARDHITQIDVGGAGCGTLVGKGRRF